MLLSTLTILHGMGGNKQIFSIPTQFFPKSHVQGQYNFTSMSPQVIIALRLDVERGYVNLLKEKCIRKRGKALFAISRFEKPHDLAGVLMSYLGVIRASGFERCQSLWVRRN
jgi:hypothetical protein